MSSKCEHDYHTSRTLIDEKRASRGGDWISVTYDWEREYQVELKCTKCGHVKSSTTETESGTEDVERGTPGTDTGRMTSYYGS